MPKKKVTEKPEEVKQDFPDITKIFPRWKELEEKTVAELRTLHQQAIYAEDAAKRELNVLRQRAANMATTADDLVDQQIIVLKKQVSEAASWLRTIELKLKGETKDIWDTKF